MRKFIVAALVCSIAVMGLVLKAQTTSTFTPIETGTNLQPQVRTNAPSEVRPTDIQSSSGEFFMKSNVFVYHGDVRVDNPQMKLRSELLTIEAPKLTNGNKYNRATALTNVVIDWVDDRGTNHATSDKAVYTYVITNLSETPDIKRFETNAMVVLTGNPIVTGPQGTFRGDPIYYDRINDTITSPNMLRMTVNPAETNTTGIFESTTPKANEPSK